MPLIQVEHGEVQAWVAGLVASGLSPSHVRDTVGVLAGVLGLAVRDRRLPSNPAHGVDLLNGPMNRPWGVRTASFADPGGHIWEIAQELSRADGS